MEWRETLVPPSAHGELPRLVRPGQMRTPGHPRRVLYTLPDGQQVAALLRSNLFSELTRTNDVRWVMLSHLAERPDFARQFEHPNVELHPLPRLLPPFFDRQLEFVRREFIHHRLDAHSARVLHQRARVVEPKRYYVHRPLARLLSGIPGIDGILAGMQHHLTFDREVGRALDSLRPDAVVLSSGAVKFPDIAVGRWARRRRLPLYGIIHSWDNLAIKGPTVPCDHLAVWNQHMVGHATQLFRYRPDQVTVTGPPHFDRYNLGRPATSRDDFLRTAGLDPNRRLLTYTTMPPMTCDFGPHFVEQLAAWNAEGRFGMPCQLLVRLHPQDNPDLYGACGKLPHVRVEIPGRYRAPVAWRQAINYYDPSECDVEHLRDTLCHSDVVLNISSTITLEAVALDRPVVNLAYNPPGSRWPVSIAEYYRLTHYRPVTESGAVCIARSPDELLEQVREALTHPERRRGERQRLWESMVTFTDGGCARRLAANIFAFLGVEYPVIAERQAA